MNTKSNKYVYSEFLKRLDKKQEKICFISEIKDVDRSNYQVYLELYTTMNIIKSFILSESLQQDLDKSKVSFYKKDDKGKEEYIRNIIKYLNNTENQVELIIIDASAINKDTLLELLFILRNIVNKEYSIEIIYITPEDYGNYQFENYTNPYALSFSPGKQVMGNKLILILLSGYEENGELGLVRYIDPSELFVGRAIPSTEDNFKIQNIENANNIIQEFSKEEGIRTRTFDCCGNNVQECIKDLEGLFKNNNSFLDSNVFLAPMNNKLTTIAAYFMWEKYSNIQIINVKGERKPDTQNESGKCHVYNLILKGRNNYEHY
jgi:hypothetical protein